MTEPQLAEISPRLRAAQPSLTKAMTQKARELAGRGVDVIALSQGELDFDTPAHVRAAGIGAIEAGHTRYTEVAGIAPLRQAVRDKFLRDNALAYELDEITIGGGAKQVLFNGLYAVAGDGDEVVFPSPCWVSYPEMVRLCGAEPVEVRTREADRWVMTPDALEAALTPRTRGLMLNSPCNPTGAVYSAKDLTGLAEVLRRWPNVWILSDDIYEPLTYGEVGFVSILNVAPGLRDRTLVINGVSKSAAMTGWRLGYGAGPKRLISAMNTLQSQTTSHASSISQHAAIAAVAGGQSHIAKFRAAMSRRRDLICERLEAIPGLWLHRPSGAFYVYVNVAALLGRRTPEGAYLATDMDVALDWLSQGVAGVPGIGFLGSPYVRLSFAASEAELESACNRIAAACGRLTPAISKESVFR